MKSLLSKEYKKKLSSGIFLIKICEKYKKLQKKLAIEQIKPCLKCSIKKLLEFPNLPNQNPHKTRLKMPNTSISVPR